MRNQQYVRKAAIVLSSLPEQQAAELLAKLAPKQVEWVSIEVAKLGRVPNDEQAAILQEFAEESPTAASGGGGLNLARALVEKALGRNAGATLQNIRQSVETLPFDFLSGVDPENIQTFLADEHPQTIALVLSYLPPHCGARVIATLPLERQVSVLRRVAQMGQTNPEVIAEVERGLENRMSNMMSQTFEHVGGVSAVAEILNVSDRTTERLMLENLAQEVPQLVEEIRRLMFVFEDIINLTAGDVQIVLRNVETSQWAMALKGASEPLREKILSNMSTRAAQVLTEEMDYLGAVRVSEVEHVQQQIVDIIRRLEDAGEITAHGADEAEELVR